MLVMARWMHEAGHVVTVVAPEASPSWTEGHEASLDMLPSPQFSRYVNSATARRWARGQQAEVMWIRDPRDLAFAGNAAQAMGAALVVQQAMQIPREKNAPWHAKRYRRVDAWVSGVEHLRQESLGRTPLVADQCHVLPLPLDERWFATPTQTRASAREGLGLNLPPETWLMGTVGRLDPGKGQRMALHALALLPERVHWLFVGDNTVNNGVDERSTLQELARDLGVTERAHFLSARRDVLPAYDALDGFGMTSAAETVGTVTLEALSRGVSVIGTDAGGTSELLAEGRGMLIPSGNAEALARAVRTAMNEEAGIQLSRADRGRTYAERSRPDRLIPAWEELIHQVVESRRKA